MNLWSCTPGDEGRRLAGARLGLDKTVIVFIVCTALSAKAGRPFLGPRAF